MEEGALIVSPSARWAPLVRPPRLNGRVLEHLLTCLTALDVDYLKQHPRVPLLYQSGVRYVAEAPGEEAWLSVPDVLLHMRGDCEDLGCWRAAELQLRGEPAKAVWSVRKTPRGNLYHIRTRRGNGQIEDPSVVLGMGR